MPPASNIPYAVNAFTSPEEELRRLREQAQHAIAFEFPTYEALGIRTGMSVVDVGAGNGDPGRLFASRGYDVTCVDADASLIENLEESLHPTLAHAEKLPFDDGSFDVAYSRLAFQHMAHPEDAISEMARVTRSGGIVIVCDADHGSGFVYPQLDWHSRAIAAWIARSRKAGADPCMGRRLPSLFVGAGLSTPQTTVRAISSDDIGPRAFAKIVLSPPVEALDAADRGVASAAVDAWATTPGAFAVTLLTITGARLD